MQATARKGFISTASPATIPSTPRPSFRILYLYGFSLNTVSHYYPDPGNAGHCNTNGYRFFYDFATGPIITK